MKLIITRHAETQGNVKRIDAVDWYSMPKDVESRSSLFKRAQQMILKAIKRYPDSTVLFVSHNALNKALIRVLRKWLPEDKTSISQENTAITIFEVSDNKSKELLFNCTKHLSKY